MEISFYDVPSRWTRLVCWFFGHKLRLDRSQVISHLDYEARVIEFKDGPGYHPSCHRCHRYLLDGERVREG